MQSEEALGWSIRLAPLHVPLTGGVASAVQSHQPSEIKWLQRYMRRAVVVLMF